MRKLTLSIAAATLATTGVALAAPHIAQGDVTRAEAEAKAAERFAKMDANGDGVLDQADRAAHQAQRFAALDADGSGEVTKAEMEAHHAQMKAKWEARRADRPERADRPDRAARSEKRGDRLDERFARLDTDNSGGLSQAEFAAGHDRMGRRGHRGGGKNPTSEAGANRTISQADFTARALKMFDAADADNNGTVTQAERTAAREKMREQWKANRAARQPG